MIWDHEITYKLSTEYEGGKSVHDSIGVFIQFQATNSIIENLWSDFKMRD